MSAPFINNAHLHNLRCHVRKLNLLAYKLLAQTSTNKPFNHLIHLQLLHIHSNHAVNLYS